MKNSAYVVLILFFVLFVSSCSSKTAPMATGSECLEGDCQNGQGILKTPSYTYVGEFKDGKRHGQGTLSYVEGEEYVGEFKDGQEDGLGTTNYPDGRKYVGEWKKGRRHGQGIMTFPDGRVEEGEFKRDEYVGGEQPKQTE